MYFRQHREEFGGACVSSHMDENSTKLATLRKDNIKKPGELCIFQTVPSTDLRFKNTGIFSYERFLRKLQNDPTPSLENAFDWYFTRADEATKVRTFVREKTVTRIKEPVLIGVPILMTFMLGVSIFSCVLRAYDKSGVKLRYDQYNGIAYILRKASQMCGNKNGQRADTLC